MFRRKINRENLVGPINERNLVIYTYKLVDNLGSCKTPQTIVT